MNLDEAERELAGLADAPKQGLSRLQTLLPLLEGIDSVFLASWHAFWGCAFAEKDEDWAQVEVFSTQGLTSLHPEFVQYELSFHAFLSRAFYYQNKQDAARRQVGRAMEVARIRPNPHAISILKVSASLGMFDDLILMGTIAAAVMSSALGKKLPEPVDELAGAKYVAQILAGYSP